MLRFDGIIDALHESTLLILPSSIISESKFQQHIVATDEQHLGHCHWCEGSKELLGNLSPYHDAPAFRGVTADLPGDCKVDQVIVVHRHGSRGPTNEQQYILGLVDTLDNAWDIIQDADLPSSLEFLRAGYKYELVPEELTIVGRQQLFDHGVQFALRYPGFSTDHVVSTSVQRVMDSAYFFSQGLFGLDIDDVTCLTTDDFDDPVSWLDPWKSCPKLPYAEAYKTAQVWAEEYIPSIVDRLNDLIPGIAFSSDDIHGALYACPYDLAARDTSPWCDAFTKRELRSFEYELDLLLDGITGHASTGAPNPGPLVGAFYIKKLIQRLTDETEYAEPLYLDFAHDFTILLALSTMGLNKDPEPLSPTHMNPLRKFRSSYQAPFAANMVWEKFTCDTSFDGPQVRLLLNGATFPLSICEASEDDKSYGTCSLDNFVSANEFSLNVAYHSAVWNATCEL
ncbi:histidine phosphatase superfamily [Chiua virens]|nr:histidine phosphatase superfamily [Chiua virens]